MRKFQKFFLTVSKTKLLFLAFILQSLPIFFWYFAMVSFLNHGKNRKLLTWVVGVLSILNLCYVFLLIGLLFPIIPSQLSLFQIMLTYNGYASLNLALICLLTSISLYLYEKENHTLHQNLIIYFLGTCIWPLGVILFQPRLTIYFNSQKLS